MFRRKDEEETQDLLTNETGSHVPTLGDGNHEKSSAENKSSASGSAASSTTGTNYPSYSSRSSEQTKSSGQSSATSYRPSAPSAPDIARSSRVPEYRPSSASPSAPSTTPIASAKETKPSTSRRVLTVGHDILLKGEIATCDRLVIEGSVDASLNEVHTVEIAETGSFKGAAEIEDAEISGEFEGELIVRNRLVIYSTGKVRGKITFGEIEIERGGELTGEIQTIAQASAGKSTATKRSKSKEADAVAA